MFDIHPSVGKWEKLFGRVVFSGGWRGLGHGEWRGGMSLKDCHVILKEGGESGVFLQSKIWFEWSREREREGPLVLFWVW